MCERDPRRDPVRVTIFEIDIAMRLHARMPYRLAPLDVLTIERDELIDRGRESLNDNKLPAARIHDADPVSIARVDVRQELIREGGARWLMN
jgi:hypothetical protein